ncbi:hypothetical protein C5B96_13345 [Subtercola sp. Z020]|uniref:STAS/SEC14 domain-containing protein n=1 Tax=Subtercola sp. Z020 TaxID=2080582 RepID=UPI000CE7EF0A|nr:STAS/SEC14 domain-containing protein [Subtercola sp. Z020]PPF79156.1 hypothetical protein C5B96_13345 [Subtercola sp. Z020]
MLTGEQIPGTHIFEVEYAGGIDAAEFDALRDRLAAFLDSNDPADVLAVYGDLDLSKIEPKALWDDLKSIGLAQKVRRAALLTDSGVLSTMAKAGSIFLKTDVRVFASSGRAEALAWLNS